MPISLFPPRNTSNMNGNRLKLVYPILLEAGAHTPPADLRELILEVDLLVASFGLGLSDRDSIDCTDSELATELVVTAAPLVRIPEDLHDVLCTEIEDALAKHAPRACVLYLAKSKLWEKDAEVWSHLIGLLVRHVKNPEAQLAITAVIAQRISGGDETDEA